MIADALGRVRDMLHDNIEDLTPQELVAGPKPHIGWFAWHLSRVQDSNIAPLAGREQAWIADGWHKRFGMPPEPRDFAPGHVQTPEMIEAFAVKDVKLILDYHDVVFERTKAYLATVSAADLDKVLNEPRYQLLPTLAVRLVSVIVDNLRHVGQIEYQRGVIRHQGWFPAAQK